MYVETSVGIAPWSAGLAFDQQAPDTTRNNHEPDSGHSIARGVWLRHPSLAAAAVLISDGNKESSLGVDGPRVAAVFCAPQEGWR